jgi:hypothetical protein
MRCISIICILGLARQHNLVKTTQSDSKAGKYGIYTVCTYTVKGLSSGVCTEGEIMNVQC